MTNLELRLLIIKILQLRNVQEKILIRLYLNKNTGNIIEAHLCTVLRIHKLQFKAPGKAIWKAKITVRLLFILIDA